ncbi:MAG TPA: hypothetical protein VNW97_13145 [Candidatus Saccharimonadales bacterium]|jgi:hypothetical protein|nr:hypothetical protein [Candidatus Saccharimonadales bacterium]
MANTASQLFRRFSAESVTTALKDTPVVMVNGPRQCGKTTLVQEFAEGDRVTKAIGRECTRINAKAQNFCVPGGTARSRALIPAVAEAWLRPATAAISLYIQVVKGSGLRWAAMPQRCPGPS